ncbi:hypothetical protein [uncultured Desulfobulbus sp.]|uniref:hypothetical protein n=1 Tax=uncultured Desulfobulbus sp. TaxID=239745 RepID=UPI0029C6CC60|nr:hypothetical protein [uncultured Desulfobulbus sp.]
MKIGIVLLYAGLGGHVRSAITIAQALESAGNSITFFLDATENNSLVDQAGFQSIKIQRGIKGDYIQLTDKIKTVKPDVIHSFAITGYAETVMSCKKLSIPCILTICGGKLHTRLINISPLVVFSNELKDAALANSSLQKDDIVVLPARIITTDYRVDSNSELLYNTFRHKYNIPDDVKIVLRIARVNRSYAQSIKIGALAVEKLYNDGCKIRFIHIGTINSYDEFNEISSLFEEINTRAGTNLVISVQDEAIRGADYTGIADFAIGVGRSAYEPMVLGIPTFVCGENGYVGIVSAENVDDIAYYNFSGRNNKAAVPLETGVMMLHKDISRLLEDIEYRKRVVDFSVRYIKENLDVNIAVKEYTDIYNKLILQGQKYPDDAELKAGYVSFSEFIRHRLRNWCIINKAKGVIKRCRK